MKLHGHPQSTHRRAASLRLLAVALLLLVSGCGKIREKREAERRAKEEAKRQARREAAIEAAREPAEKLYDQLVAGIPAFDRDKARHELTVKHLKRDPATIELKTVNEVEAILAERVERAVNVDFPPARREKLLDQVNKEFATFKVGDTVEIETVTHRTFSGVITQLDGRFVKLGAQYVLISDINTPPPVRFDAEKAQKWRDYQMRLNFDIGRRDAVLEKTKQMRKAVYDEFGYIQRGKRWIRFDAIVKARIDPLVDAQEQEYLAKAKAKAKIRELVTEKLVADGVIDAAMNVTADDLLTPAAEAAEAEEGGDDIAPGE